ncbi:hypothetical protein RIF29_08643 [Crotalaria pallida]|uniref:Uncharacterized protein n=1 Tax=Crotalaria pallida TaxID=3830 RepID=A0AAN9FYT9_CROPI
MGKSQTKMQAPLYNVSLWLYFFLLTIIVIEFNDCSIMSWNIKGAVNKHDDILRTFHDPQPSLCVPPMVSWSTPAADYFKLNFDGSALGNPGHAGFGGLLTDSLGHWVAF